MLLKVCPVECERDEKPQIRSYGFIENAIRLWVCSVGAQNTNRQWKLNKLLFTQMLDVVSCYRPSADSPIVRIGNMLCDST